jgi:hypothetical protein
MFTFKLAAVGLFLVVATFMWLPPASTLPSLPRSSCLYWLFRLRGDGFTNA